MKFVHPEILWALTALSIPIIVHLFNFRKFRKVQFSNVAFLKEIRQETKSKSRLKHLLILFSRLLAVAAIVLAFAQPYLPKSNSTVAPGDKAVSLYIDNSFSMEAQGEQGPLLELAKSKAIEVASAYGATDRFQVLTNDFEGRHQRFVGRDEVIELIQSIEFSPVSRKLSEVFEKQKDLLNNSGLTGKSAYIFSDLQQPVTDIAALSNDTSISVRLIPSFAPGTENLYIDSVWFETPVRMLNQPENLHVRLMNLSENERQNVPVSLKINGQVKIVSSTNVAAGASSEVTLTYTNTEAGLKNATVVIDDYPVTFDNEYFLSYRVLDKINVHSIKGSFEGFDAVEALFGEDPAVSFSGATENSIDYGKFASQHLIILNQLKNLSSGLQSELKKFADNGGSVLILPNKDADLITYNQLSQVFGFGVISSKTATDTKVQNVNDEHFLLKNVFKKTEGNLDLPTIKSMFTIERSTQSMTENVMSTMEGSPFFMSNSFGKGRVYFSVVSLDPEESSFVNNSFFPTLLIRISEFSQPVTELSYLVGTDEPVALRNITMSAEETFKMRNVGSGEEQIPEHRSIEGTSYIYVPKNIMAAGHYDILKGSEVVSGLGLNYSGLESDTRTLAIEKINEEIQTASLFNFAVVEGSTESIGKLATEKTEESTYWYGLIVCALIFLAIEVLLIKFWR